MAMGAACETTIAGTHLRGSNWAIWMRGSRGAVHRVECERQTLRHGAERLVGKLDPAGKANSTLSRPSPHEHIDSQSRGDTGRINMAHLWYFVLWPRKRSTPWFCSTRSGRRRQPFGQFTDSPVLAASATSRLGPGEAQEQRAISGRPELDTKELKTVGRP